VEPATEQSSKAPRGRKSGQRSSEKVGGKAGGDGRRGGRSKASLADVRKVAEAGGAYADDAADVVSAQGLPGKDKVRKKST